ncbi:uridine kinase [Planococcus sp. NCCP-2050]|uniref:uridine kinase family protein n=1 Tax=Planococcus sp. NCCP-2050 TaxID=2944679 RepID=UPI002041F153|nr:phosphoribulokinase [Planococcus sp. NCCP-2050]GKW44508.1 uridine kinase [Planococcus sp. NCCP-2050]
MDGFIQELAERIGHSEKKLLIGISGHGAAGKTVFANKLIDRIGRNKTNYLNTDPYIINSSVRKNTVLEYTYENQLHRFKMTACHPGAHHLPSLERDVRMIRDGLSVRTIDTHYMESELLSADKKLSIVEGMSVAFLNPALFDLKIYLYTDGQTEFERRAGRDVLERGAELEYLRQSHVERRIQYEIFMHPSSQSFDIILKTIGEEMHIEKASSLSNLIN